MNFILLKYIFTCFPLEILYMLSMISTKTRKQVIKYHSKIKMGNFKEILLSLLLRKIDHKWIYNFNITNFQFHSKDYFSIQGKYYINLPLTKINEPVILFLCKFKKRKLLKYVFRNLDITFVYHLSRYMKIYDVRDYIVSKYQFSPWKMCLELPQLILQKQ